MPTVRNLMLKLVLFTQVPACLAVGALLALHYGSERERVGGEMVAHARALAFALDEQMLAVQRQLEGLAARVPAGAGDWPAFRGDARLVQQLTGADAIVLATAAGEPVVDTRLAAGPPATFRLSEPMLARLRTGAPAYTVQGAAEAPEWPHAAVSVPILGEDGLRYVLVAGLQRSRFQPLLVGQGLPEGWISSIVDDRGVIMARVPDAERMVGRNVREKLQAALARGDRGAFEARSVDGVSVVAAYIHSPLHGWTAMVAVPKARLYAPLWRNAAWQALAALVLLTLTMVLTLRISRRVGERLDESEQRLHAILHTATDAIVVSDARWRVVLMNDAAERLFGPAPECTGERGLERLIAPATWPHFEELCRRRRAGEIVPMEELAMLRGQGRRADGGLFPMEYSLSHFTDARGEGFCTLFVRDITRRLQRDASLIAARSALRRMTRDFDKAIVRETASRQAAVARELHDAVGSSLAGLSLLLGTARAFAHDPESTVLIRKSQEQVDRATQQVRRLSRGMMPAGEERGALVPALQRFASETCELPGVSCRFDSRGKFDEVSAESGAHLYRIVQEASSNALRHGGATHLHVMLARAGGLCRLTIRDNGAGCDLSGATPTPQGVGLRSMRARAEAVGGVMQVRRRSAGGLAIRVTWRADEPAARPAHHLAA